MVVRRFASALCILVGFSFAAWAGSNRWTAGGPYGGNVYALAVDPSDPSIVYAGTGLSGIFKSVDGGATWASASRGLEAAYAYASFGVNSVAIDPISPSVLYAGTYAGVYKSTDGGASWEPKNEGFVTTAYAVSQVVIDPLTPTTIYSLRGGELYKTIDGGENWVNANFSDISYLAIDPLSPSTLYAAVFWGVAKSVDGGTTWQTYGAGMPISPAVTLVAVDPVTPSTVYAATNGEQAASYRLYRSVDSGLHWSAASPQNTQVFSLAIDPRAPSTLYLGSMDLGPPVTGKVLKSTDAGATWTNVGSGLPGRWVQSLVIDPAASSRLYASTVEAKGCGVFVSADGGTTWSASNTGLASVRIRDVAVDPVHPSTLYAASWGASLGSGGGGVFKSEDRGASFIETDAGISTDYVMEIAVHPSESSTLYAATFYGVSKSVDAGSSWSSLVAPGMNLTGMSVALDPTAPATLYVGTSQYVFRSEDAGSTWTSSRLVQGYGTSPNIRAVVVDPKTPANVYAGVYAANNACFGIYKSQNSGTTWTPVNEGLPFYGFPGERVYRLTIDPSAPSTVYAALGGWGIYRTQSGGDSWSKVDMGGSGQDWREVAIDSHHPGTLYAASATGGVFRSTDGASTWAPLNDGLTHPGVVSLALDPETGKTLYAGTDGGGVFSIDPVPPPVVSLVKKVSPPFKLVITGSGFKPGIKAFINGTEWGSVVYKNAGKIQLTGAGLKAAVPKGSLTDFTFVNTDGGTAVVSDWKW